MLDKLALFLCLDCLDCFLFLFFCPTLHFAVFSQIKNSAVDKSAKAHEIENAIVHSVVMVRFVMLKPHTKTSLIVFVVSISNEYIISLGTGLRLITGGSSDF
jgi:hypothetical protein